MHNEQWISNCNFSVFGQIQKIFACMKFHEKIKLCKYQIQQNWAGITTRYVNVLLSARVNLRSATTNRVYFQEINVLIESLRERLTCRNSKRCLRIASYPILYLYNTNIW